MSITIVDGWIKEAIGMDWGADSFGRFAPGQPKWIVLHGTAWPGGTAQIIGQSWQDATARGVLGPSTHIIINKDGSCVQGISLLSTASGNCCKTDNPYTGGRYGRYLPDGNQNYTTISIEHCKNDSAGNSDVLTPAQQTTSFQIVRACCQTYGIPMRVITQEDVSGGGIIRHRDIDALNRWYCPGPYPFAALQAYLHEGGDVNIFLGPHANDTRVQYWRSFSLGIGRNPPREGTGFFASWIEKLNAGINVGSPTGPEWPLTQGDGSQVMAQNFSGGALVTWDEANAQAIWH